jgi:ribosomal protein S18 acetylase RimI-like enzyme
MLHLLDNIVWHALTGAQAKFAAGAGGARRYARGFSPIVGFADRERPDFAALAPYCDDGEHFYCDGWSGAAPAGWRVEAETTMFKMVWQGRLPPLVDEPGLPLQAAHAPQALELAALTRPGPFGPRTIELGDYLGVFDGARLVAMAGERMQAGPLREISGVCTHPPQQGRGLARRLMLELVRRQLQRGSTPFLHVMRDNEVAHGLYRRMGFADQGESVVRVIARVAD